MKKNICILADDDSAFVSGIMDTLKIFFMEKNFQFEVCMSREEIKKIKEEEVNIIIAIVDIWFIDKKTNKAYPKEGFNIIDDLRKKWPNCYIVVLSGHLNSDNNVNLEREYKNIKIFEKPIIVRVLKQNLDEILKGII